MADATHVRERVARFLELEIEAIFPRRRVRGVVRILP